LFSCPADLSVFTGSLDGFPPQDAIRIPEKTIRSSARYFFMLKTSYFLE
jgi:hypothetical protein